MPLFLHLVTTLRVGLRSRSFHGALAAGLLILGIAFLGGQFSTREPQTVVISLALSGFGLVGILLSLLWTQELYTRELSSRRLHLALTHPAPRSHFLLGRFLGVCVLTALTMALFGALLWGLGVGLDSVFRTPAPRLDLGWPLAGTMAFLWLQLVVITAFTWLIATATVTATLPFALGLAFAVAGRSLGPALAYLKSGEGTAQTLQGPLGPTVASLHWLIPDLSRLDLRPWVLYGTPPDTAMLWLGPMNSLGFSLLMLGLAMFVLRRRDLG